eukprot:TRINITY_DN2644_c0_g1_i1.p1 TRINITY_DN2644_c0_g1~~TRINITY_DN2644_c0_g1_i1.p1  ORF type:complete len:133 (-),score=27.63 TRINITY_DN2644_c0_g1_i1:100-468(-)
MAMPLKSVREAGRRILLTKRNVIAGHAIEKDVGLVSSSVSYVRGSTQEIGLFRRLVFGGEMPELTAQRNVIIDECENRLKDEAATMGADAVVAVSYTHTSTGKFQEVIMNGTAVTLDSVEKK